MPPVEPQVPQNLPPEADQDQQIIQFLQELEDRITALEEKVLKDEEEDKTENDTETKAEDLKEPNEE